MMEHISYECPSRGCCQGHEASSQHQHPIDICGWPQPSHGPILSNPSALCIYQCGYHTLAPTGPWHYSCIQLIITELLLWVKHHAVPGVGREISRERPAPGHLHAISSYLFGFPTPPLLITFSVCASQLRALPGSPYPTWRPLETQSHSQTQTSFLLSTYLHLNQSYPSVHIPFYLHLLPPPVVSPRGVPPHN